jgi:hypothetical protein
MQKKYEYVITEVNQPTAKAIQQFHEHFHEFMLRITNAEEKNEKQSVDAT